MLYRSKLKVFGLGSSKEYASSVCSHLFNDHYEYFRETFDQL